MTHTGWTGSRSEGTQGEIECLEIHPKCGIVLQAPSATGSSLGMCDFSKALKITTKCSIAFLQAPSAIRLSLGVCVCVCSKALKTTTECSIALKASSATRFSHWMRLFSHKHSRSQLNAALCCRLQVPPSSHLTCMFSQRHSGSQQCCQSDLFLSRLSHWQNKTEQPFGSTARWQQASKSCHIETNCSHLGQPKRSNIHLTHSLVFNSVPRFSLAQTSLTPFGALISLCGKQPIDVLQHSMATVLKLTQH